MRKPMFELFSDYNATMNLQWINSMNELSNDNLLANNGAFFCSILGTMNHLMVGDIIWLNRFALLRHFETLQSLKQLPLPKNLNDTITTNLLEFSEKRMMLDKLICSFIKETNEVDYDAILIYQNMSGKTFNKAFGLLLSHFFNHQTHHRGQASTLLLQQNKNVGVTDFLTVIPSF